MEKERQNKQDKTQNGAEQIELRSGNARQFITEEPPFLIRYGTAIIVLFLLLMVIAVYLENYEQ